MLQLMMRMTTIGMQVMVVMFLARSNSNRAKLLDAAVELFKNRCMKEAELEKCEATISFEVITREIPDFPKRILTDSTYFVDSWPSGTSAESWFYATRGVNSAFSQGAPILFAEVALLIVEAGFCTPENLGRFNGFPEHLDTGIYWFGKNDTSEKATASPSKLYNPKKPTMLFFHGWTGEGVGWTSQCKRLTTRCHSDMCPNGGGQHLVNSWLDEGWNVGFFYWDQFADEECVRDAEQKLWFDKRAAYYRNYHEELDELSVADMCALSVKKAMGTFDGSQVRFVGHSLGAQLAVRCASMLHVEDHPAAPHRVSLLEPYFTRHSHVLLNCHGQITADPGLGDFAERLTVEYVMNMWKTKGVVTDVYKSSLLTEERPAASAFTVMKNIVTEGPFGVVEKALVGNLGAGLTTEGLDMSATVVEYQPDWCEDIQSQVFGDVENLRCRHCASIPMYLLSFELERSAPALNTAEDSEEPGASRSRCMMPSASCVDDHVREWVQRQLDMKPTHQIWNQIAGQQTFDKSDDVFELTPALGLQSPGEALSASPVHMPAKREQDAFLHSPILSAIGIVMVCLAVAVLHRHMQSQNPQFGLMASPHGYAASFFSGHPVVLATADDLV
ncbi:TTL1 [Symbiodinium sp. CCMP2456]|nr:TTL1 [Symbiodinium sp. CCMP2456]